MRRLALVPIIASVLLFPSAAAALGLGEIEMQSALNQRLDAEIPLRGVVEGESDDITVAIASEEAFQQVGLKRTFALTKLRFEIKQRDDGAYYVHATSREPVAEPFLNFLVEVDWPGGNLLREYTVLLDPPVFVSEKPDSAADEQGAAPAASGDDSVAAAGVPGEIERETPEGEARPAEEEEPDAAAAEAPASKPATEGDFSDTPVFLEVEKEQERAEEAARQAAAEPDPASATRTQAYEPEPKAPAPAQDSYGPVRRGEALWNIAAQLKRSDMTVQQMMLALLRYNPEAFAGDNINRLREGYVLRVPERSEVARVSAQRAVARVGEQALVLRSRRFEVRVQLPSGRGTWPAIWMLPTHDTYGPDYWPDNGEIDIMEHVGYAPDTVHTTVHTEAYNHTRGTQRGEAVRVPDARSDFNVYAVEWTPQKIRGYVNDEHYFTFENERRTDDNANWQEWPFDHPFHFVLNIAVGGSWGGAEGTDPSIWPQTMRIDYVRVYRPEE